MQEMKLELYWNELPTGKENAVSYSELCAMWNASERSVRKILHQLSTFDNGDNFILIRSSKNKGFYKTDEATEIAEYKKECLHRGRNVFAPIKKINRVQASKGDMQYSFTNNLRIVRETLGLTQDEVCTKLKHFDTALDKPTLSKMENGVFLPTPYQLNALALLYGCEPSELIEAELYWWNAKAL